MAVESQVCLPVLTLPANLFCSPDYHLALLKAIGDRLIPGIPEETKIALLQQTRLTDGDAESRPSDGPVPTVLQEVIDKATARSVVEQEIRGTSSANTSSKLS